MTSTRPIPSSTQPDWALALPPPSLLGRPDRVLAADGLRGLAALAIVVHHASFVAGTTFRPGAAGAALARLDVAVPVFFALSGFLLFEPYLRRIVTGDPFPPLWSFWRRRLVRIFPAYWLALLVQLAIGSVAVAGVGGFLLCLSLTQIYDNPLTGIVQAWSLGTELAFYLVLPLFALAARRLVGRRPPHQQLLLVAGLTMGWIVASVLSRVVVLATEPPGGANFRFTVLANADYFAVGMLCAVLMVGVRLGGPFARLHTTLFRRPTRWYLAGVAVFLITATQLGVPRGLENGSGRVELARQTGYLATALCLAAPACCAGVRGPLQRLLASPPLVWTGVVSYGVYLWHQVFLSAPGDEGGLLLRWFGWPVFDAPLLPLVVLAVPGALVLGAASWYLLERPILERVR